ncbi:YDG domain-containing protein [Eubacterium limosum]|uniref:YDG domain-containing protein n=1 Tax=Eubacterium limosum TaxID=1736 RepID=UPI001063966E|nr:YDG domain-containing protein [Eubacterium limosum]
MDVEVKKFRGAGLLKTALLLLAALLGLLVFGAGTARAEEGAVVYGLYETNNRLYACDDKGTKSDPEKEIRSDTITNLFVAEGVTEIESGTFSSCESLKEVTLPDTVTEIGLRAFFDSGLANIILSKNLTTIGPYAFAGCDNLREITLPENLKTIENAAFQFCGGLTRVVLSSATPPTANSDVFYLGASAQYMVLTGAAATSGEYDGGWAGLTKTKALGIDVTPSITDQTYTGSALEPGIPGTKDTDYQVTYEDNTNVGQATAHITADGCLGMYTGSADVSFTITPAPLTIKGLSAQSRPYDGTAAVTLTGGSLEGVIGSEDVSIAMPVEGTVADASKGTEKPVTYTLPELQGSDKDNYSLTAPELKANITAASLTIEGLSAQNRPYDGSTAVTLTGGSLEGVFGSDDVRIDMPVEGTVADASKGTEKPVTYTLPALQGSQKDNYSLTAPELKADITAAPLTIEGMSAQNRPYDGSTAVTLDGGSLEGVIGSEDVSIAMPAEGTVEDANKGTEKRVTYTLPALQGSQKDNYSLTAPELKVNITAAPLAIEGLSAQNRPYDGSTAVTLTGGSLKGIFGSDDVSIDMPVEGTVADANKGTEKLVTYTLPALQGSQKDNYSLTAPEVKADITPAPLTIEGLSAKSRPYDGSNAVTLTGGSLEGVFGSDDVRIDMPVEGTVADASKGMEKVVTYTLPALQGSQKDNYSLTAPELKANITAAPLTIEGLSAQNRPYDGSNAVTLTGGSLKGVIGSEDVSIAMPAEGTVADASKGMEKVVTYTLPALQGSQKDNYSLTAPEVKADITPAPLTLAGGAIAAKTYDGTTGTTVESVSFAGLQKDETLIKDTDYTAAAAFKDANVGDDKAATLTVNLMANDKTANYTLEGSKTIAVKGNIAKATPAYELPKDLTAVYGQTLKDVALPEGFSWQDPEDTAVGNAGSNTFKATYTPADPANYQTVADIDVSITVSKGESTLVVQADKTQFTYGEAFTLTVDVALKPQSRSLTRAAADTVDFYLGDPADNRQLATALVENGKATATIEQSNPNYPNGGNADITVVYNGSDSLNKSMGSLHLDITPAAGSAQVSQAGWTYGQTGASPVPVSETNGTENVTYAYKTKDAGDDTYQAEKPTNAGQYTLRATFAATQNYKVVTATADFTIEKAQPVMTIAPEAGKEIQVGEPVTLNIALKGVKDETPEGTVAILGKNLTLKDGQASIAYTPADTKPITLTAIYTPAEGENYTSAEANTTLTAGKKTRERITLSDLTKTYGDPAFTLTPIGGSLQAGESCQYASDNAAVATVDQNGEVTLHQAGTAHITVSVAESSAWNPAAATMTLTVDKAQITGVSFEDTAFTEDGAEHKIELTGSLPEGTSVSYENNVQKAPGTYTAKAIIDGGVNYESLELTAVLTINEKPADPTPGQPTPTPGTGSDTTSNPAPENTTNNTTERTTDNTNTGLAGSGTTAVAAVLLSLLALTGLVLWQKSKKQ